MVEHIKLKVSADDEDTGDVLAEGQMLRVEDVLWGLGYKFTIEVDPND